MIDRIAHRLEQRPHAREILRRGADHEQRFASISVGGEPPDRCIDERHAFLGRFPGQRIGCQRIDRAHVHDEAAGLGVRENAIQAGNDLVDDRGVRQHGDDDPGLARDCGDGFRAPRLQQFELCDRIAIDVVHDQPEPLAAQV